MAGALAYDLFAKHRLTQDDRIFGAALGMLVVVVVVVVVECFVVLYVVWLEW